MKKVVCFGELMLRLNPSGYLRIVQADALNISFAGGEANVAVSLANFGMESYFVSKLPRTVLGEAARNSLRRYGVQTKDILWGGPRIGVYFVEKGASQRASNVIYDRAGSSVQLSKRDEYDWNSILEGADWFYFTGITPALGGALPDICIDALEACKRKGVKVGCDLNYRKKLWSAEAACRTMSKMMPYVDVLIANESDAYDVFGIKAHSTDLEKGILDKLAYAEVARSLSEKFGISTVAITLRTSISASVNRWAGMMHKDGVDYYSPEYTINIVDRIGGGDSFGAGLIYSLSKECSPQRTIDFAVAASCLKHSIENDFNLVSEEEVMSLVSGNASGRVLR